MFQGLLLPLSVTKFFFLFFSFFFSYTSLQEIVDCEIKRVGEYKKMIFNYQTELFDWCNRLKTSSSVIIFDYFLELGTCQDDPLIIQFIS